MSPASDSRTLSIFFNKAFPIFEGIDIDDETGFYLLGICADFFAGACVA
jgi:hypothetical protein